MNEVGEGNMSEMVSGTPLDSTSDASDPTLPIALAITAVLAIVLIAFLIRKMG
ncbi:MAG: hypothetical protein GKC03_09230 [Methanomassiliicoccales archaeon]|nr:hypothetical protein [Methanomassiliicoccales archaeon]NYT14622.1 hypothetical protein [Methanomassiliicoccales archaeon]